MLTGIAAHYKRALNCAQKGDHAGAVADFRRALEVEPRHQYAKYMRDYIAKWGNQ